MLGNIPQTNLNKLLDIFLIVIGILSMAYYFCLKLIYNRITFSFTFFIFGSILILYGFLELILKINFLSVLPSLLKDFIIIILALSSGIFLIIQGIIIFNGNVKSLQKPDYLMVLGAGLKNGTISTSLKYRLDTALEFHKEYPDVNIIVSGGQGPDEPISEAQAMKSYLINNGIPKNLIISEDQSTTTYENFLYTQDLLKEKTGTDDYTFTVISNNFHMFRAKYLGATLGIKCFGYPAPSAPLTSFNYYTREFFAVLSALFFAR